MQFASLVVGLDAPHPVTSGIVDAYVRSYSDLGTIEKYPERSVIVGGNLAVTGEADIDDLPVFIDQLIRVEHQHCGEFPVHHCGPGHQP